MAGGKVNLESGGTPGTTGTIIWSGWVKYFKFQTSTESVIKSNLGVFYKNKSFYDQQKKVKDIDLDEKKGKDYKYVHSITDFYVALFDGILNISTDRINDADTVYDNISIKRIPAVPDVKGFSGGLSVLEKKYAGLECFTIKQGMGSTKYLICSKDAKNLSGLLMNIKQQCIQTQRRNGHVLVEDTTEETKKKEAQALALEKSSKKAIAAGTYLNTTLSSVTFSTESGGLQDGYWIELQNWSSCTKACGGGTQTFQRMCVPPKKGGQPCKGERLLHKKCNVQVCPVTEHVSQKFGKKEIIEKAQVKILPFSNRYQKYTKCVVKEGDAILMKNLAEFSKQTNQDTKYVKVPVRLILNTNTLVVLEGGQYEKQLYTFDIEKTKIVHNPNFQECFYLTETAPTIYDHQESLSFCPFGLPNTNTGGAEEWRSEWDYDFNLFKFQCKKKKPTTSIKEKKKADKEMNNKMSEAKADILQKKEERLILKLKNEEITNTAKTSKTIKLRAIQKEFDLEALLEKEAVEAQRNIENELKLKIKNEKNKRECLIKKIKEKEIENQYNLRMESVDLTKKEDDREAKDMINISRGHMRNKLNELKRRSLRRQRKMQQELKGVRTDIEGDLKAAYKTKRPDLCEFKIKLDALNYCTTRTNNFQSTDMTKCTTAVSSAFDDHNLVPLCEICCTNEIGSMNTAEIDACQAKCNPIDINPNNVSEKWYISLPNDKISVQSATGILRQTAGDTKKFVSE
jgi:hypothetical protein